MADRHKVRLPVRFCASSRATGSGRSGQRLPLSRWRPSTTCCPLTTPRPRAPSRCWRPGWHCSSGWSPSRSAPSSCHGSRLCGPWEALATSVPLFLLLFASAYAVLPTISVRNFGQPLTHTDALYFTVTVFSTVGSGDITAKTEAARLVVNSQMIADLLIIGLGITVIPGAVTRSRQQRPKGADTG